MITTPTAFILGAGASIPYDFPSGPELRDAICLDSAPKGMLSEVLSNTMRVDPALTADFGKAFQRSALSVDAFLSRRLEYKDIGKLCIAVELCRREMPARVLRLDNKDNWYALLWEALTRDVMTLADAYANQVKIVTFNYDRSLEYFLFEAAKHTFRASYEEALKYVNWLGVLHVYGCLGAFGPEPVRGVRIYTDELTTETIQTAAAGIRVIPEARNNDSVFTQAGELVAWCRRLCFLGFGFDFLNLSRLNIPAILERMNPRPQIVLSTLGKTNVELEAYRSRICPERAWAAYAMTNSMTVRESGVLL